MRLTLAVALLVCTCLAVPAVAQSGGVVVSKFNCPQALPCNGGDPAFPSPDKVVAMANACMARAASSTVEGGFFDASAGIDSNGCLSTKSEVSSNAQGKSAIPRCCIQQMPTGSCAIHCDMIVQ